jgi:hypothetical protein
MQTIGRKTILSAACIAVAVISSCGRNAVPMTECVNGKPVIERIKDVAPPNCAPVPAAG